MITTIRTKLADALARLSTATRRLEAKIRPAGGGGSGPPTLPQGGGGSGPPPLPQ